MMIRESLFYETDIDFEKFIEHHIKLDHLDQIRNELEIYYVNVKNNASEFTGCSIDRFFTLNYNDFSETINSILVEFTQIKSRIDEVSHTLDANIIKLSSILKKYQNCQHEKRNTITTLNIINYNNFLTSYIDNYEAENADFETFDKMILKNGIIINLVEVFIEMMHLPIFIEIPTILKNIINFSDDRNHYKIENRFNEVLINHLKILINYILYSCALDGNYFVIEQLLNYYNELCIQKLIEKTFRIFFDEMVRSCNSFHDVVGNILKIISDKNCLFNRIINSGIQFQWKFDILSNSLIYSLSSYVDSINYLLHEPQYFHDSFVKINSFLQSIETLFLDENQIRIFRKNQNVINLLKQWNILTYFQIRRRYLITIIDEAVQEFESNSIHVKDAPNKLFNVVTRMLKYCFECEIALPQLSSRFWGLFQQTNYIVLEKLKNYVNSFNIKLKHKSKVFNYDDDLDGLIRLQHCLDSYHDSISNIIESNLKSFLSSNGICTFLSIDHSKIDILKSINCLKFFFEDLIIKIAMNRVNPVLEEVKNIPRIFRNTTRENPTSPSPHILNIINIIDNLYKKYDKIDILTKICNLTKNNLIHISDGVRDYMKKSELTLLRFKKPSSNSTTTSYESYSQDLIKVNNQLEIDISYINEKLFYGYKL